MPEGCDLDKCLITMGRGHFPSELQNWRYRPRIAPRLNSLLCRLCRGSTPPWPTLPGSSRLPGLWFGVNARHLRYHYDLWQEIRPKVLRGVHTTIVFATPQIGFSLSPHINLTDLFLYFGALARAYAPVQLFPAAYLYPDANLGRLAGAPAPIFADMLPVTGGNAFPVIEWTPDPWGVLAHYDVTDRYYGYPFRRTHESQVDTTFRDTDSEPNAAAQWPGG